MNRFKHFLFCLLLFLSSEIALATTYPIGLAPTTIVSSASMTSNVTSPAIAMLGVTCVDVQLVWTGTPTGTFAFQVSEDASTWDALTLSATISASGSAGHGTMEVCPVGAPYFDIVYTASGSTGTLTVTAFGKRQGS